MYSGSGIGMSKRRKEKFEYRASPPIDIAGAGIGL
jgi:hypothetical protein